MEAPARCNSLAASLVLLVLLVGCGPDQPDPAADAGVDGSQIDPEDADDGDDRDADTSSDGGVAPDVGSPEVSTERLFPTESNPGEEFHNCVFTSPLRYEEGDEAWVLVSRSNGVVDALDPDTGESQWSVELPEPDEGVKYLLADPARVGNHLVYVYHVISENFGKYLTPNDQRLAHKVAVVDLEERAVDEDFPPVELQAEVEANEPGETVTFKPHRALSRPKVVHGAEAGDELGKVYMGQGNTRDIQPWHGWAWEVDLDVWKSDGAAEAITGVFNTTPEPDGHCGEPGTSGSTERLCGGGVWAPSGHLVVQEDDSYRVVLAPGNGQLNLNKRDYANTLLKMEPGLELNRKCDEDACSDFDPDQPSQECIESCQNVFIPRLMPGQEIPKPSDGRCEDRDTMFSCWEEMDYIGGSTPVHLEFQDHELLAYPTKDGHTYLVDWEHFGTMHDREKMVPVCGSGDVSCWQFWAGMSVTKPLKTQIDGNPAVMVPTFMPDPENPAGVVAMKVVETDDGPRLERAWEYPDFDSDRVSNRFRRHPSRMAFGPHGPNGEKVAWIVDVKSDEGFLTAIDPQTGEAVVERKLTDNGRRYTVPLTTEDRVYVSSCHSGNQGPAHIEGYEINQSSE